MWTQNCWYTGRMLSQDSVVCILFISFDPQAVESLSSAVFAYGGKLWHAVHPIADFAQLFVYMYVNVTHATVSDSSNHGPANHALVGLCGIDVIEARDSADIMSAFFS